MKLTRLIRRLDIDLVHQQRGRRAARRHCRPDDGVPVVGTLTNIAGKQVRLVDNPT
jgi:hypothetical protein